MFDYRDLKGFAVLGVKKIPNVNKWKDVVILWEKS